MMKRNRSLTRRVVAAVISAVLFCGLTHWLVRGPAGQVMVDDPVYDAGKVGQNSEIKHKFRIWNKSRRLVRLKPPKTSCTCSAALLQDSKQALAPGEFVDLEMTLKTQRKFGKVVERAYLATDSPEAPMLQLTLTCFVTSPLRMSPNHASFGPVRCGSEKERLLMIREDSDDPLTHFKASSTSEYVACSLTRIQPGFIKSWHDTGGYMLRVRLKPDAPVGFLKAKVILESSNKKATHVELPVTADVRGDLEARPQALFWGMLKPGQVKSVNLDIRRAKNSDAQVLAIRSESANVTGRIIEKNATGELAARIEVSCHPDQQSKGIFHANLWIETTSEHVSIIRVKATGFCSGPG